MTNQLFFFAQKIDLDPPSASEVDSTDIKQMETINDVLDYLIWGAGVAAVFAIMIIAIKIVVSRAGSNPEGAAKALGGLPWIAGALVLALSSLTIVKVILA